MGFFRKSFIRVGELGISSSFTCCYMLSIRGRLSVNAVSSIEFSMCRGDSPFDRRSVSGPLIGRARDMVIERYFSVKLKRFRYLLVGLVSVSMIRANKGRNFEEDRVANVVVV